MHWRVYVISKSRLLSYSRSRYMYYSSIIFLCSKPLCVTYPELKVCMYTTGLVNQKVCNETNCTAQDAKRWLKTHTSTCKDFCFAHVYNDTTIQPLKSTALRHVRCGKAMQTLEWDLFPGVLCPQTTGPVFSRWPQPAKQYLGCGKR